MSGANWFYCNLFDEASAVVHVIQPYQNDVNGIAKLTTDRLTAMLVPEIPMDDGELAVARSMYALVAATPDSDSVVISNSEAKSKVQTLVTEQVVVTKTLVSATGTTKVAEVEIVAEEVATKEERKGEGVGTFADAIKDEVAGAVASNTFTKPSTDVVQTLAGEGDAAVMKGLVEVAAAEATIIVETAEETIETVSVADKEVVAAGMGGALIEEDHLVDLRQVADEPIAEPVVAEDVFTKESVAAAPSTLNAISSQPVTEKVTGEFGQAKPVSDDESETETQSEKSEANASETGESIPAAKNVDEPSFEIDETMVIDPDVAAEELSTQASSVSFIPEQFCKNSYAISSVAVAVTTAIVATLMARR